MGSTTPEECRPSCRRTCMADAFDAARVSSVDTGAATPDGPCGGGTGAEARVWALSAEKATFLPPCTGNAAAMGTGESDDVSRAVGAALATCESNTSGIASATVAPPMGAATRRLAPSTATIRTASGGAASSADSEVAGCPARLASVNAGTATPGGLCGGATRAIAGVLVLSTERATSLTRCPSKGTCG